MSHFLRNIAIATSLLLAVCPCSIAQSADFDVVLDRYEYICERCLELRGRVSAGEAVPQKTIVSLMEELGKLRSSLQETSGKMTSAQRSRFERIKNSYRFGRDNDPSAASAPVLVTPVPAAPASTASAPDALLLEAGQAVPESQSAVTAPVRKVFDLPAIETAVRYCAVLNSDVGVDLPAYEPREDVSPLPVEAQPATPHWKVGVMGNISVNAKPLYGASLFCSYNRVGLWCAGRIKGLSLSWDGTTTSSGDVSGGGKFWGDGTSKESSKMVLAGPLFNVTDFLSIYGGAGYGHYNLVWRSIDGTFYQVSDRSFSSVALEAGLMFHISNLSLSIGLNRFESYSAILGVGVNF